MKNATKERKLFDFLMKKLNELWHNDEIQSAITLSYAEESQFNRNHPDFQNIKELQKKLRPLLVKFL